MAELFEMPFGVVCYITFRSRIQRGKGEKERPIANYRDSLL